MLRKTRRPNKNKNKSKQKQKHFAHPRRVQSQLDAHGRRAQKLVAARDGGAQRPRGQVFGDEAGRARAAGARLEATFVFVCFQVCF
jgi:hypothetical protein